MQTKYIEKSVVYRTAMKNNLLLTAVYKTIAQILDKTEVEMKNKFII